MVSQATEAVAGLERYRLQLEENVEKLRKALQHWQTWEAEYEGLKEEVEALPSTASPNELANAALTSPGKLVDEKETREILGLDKGAPRTVQQIVGLLDRRIDYVHRNVTSVQKQFDAAEMKLYNLDAIKQETVNDEGLPLTEISEELDEDGNIVSSQVTHPGEAPEKVLDTLKKLGVEEKDLAENEEELAEQDEVPLTISKEESHGQGEAVSISTKDSATFVGTSKPSAGDVLPKKKPKSVSFASELDVAPEHAAASDSKKTPIQSQTIASNEKPITMATASSVPGITNLAAGSFPSNARVLELDENDMPIAVNAPHDPTRTPIIPPNESEEDALLRREMLQYSMSEVGAVVAQMDIEERGSDESEFSDENYDIDEDDADDYDYGSGMSTDDDEDEDVHGISRKSRITADYRRKMEELERKLNAQMMENLGPRLSEEVLKKLDPTADAEADLASDARVLRVQKDSQGNQANSDPLEQKTSGGQTKQKGVRFAESLEVAPANDTISASSAQAAAEVKARNVPFKDTIKERNPTATAGNTNTKTSINPAEAPRKQSRFRAAQQKDPAADAFSQQQQPPPNTHPLADTVVERQPPAAAAVKPPSRSDPYLRQKQLGLEAVQQRNRLIYRQGGFLRDDQDDDEQSGEIDADEDEDTGAPRKRVSRFMAARIRGS